jgi:hypothetical protein
MTKSINAGITSAKIIRRFKGVGFLNFARSVSVILFAIGDTAKAAGKANKKPLIPDFSQSLKKPGVKPFRTLTIIRDIKKPITIDIKSEKVNLSLNFINCIKLAFFFN